MSRARCFHAAFVAAATLACAALAADPPKPATRAGLRGDGTLLVDGRPVFPIAVRSEKADAIAPIAATGCNMILGSGEWGEDHYRIAREKGLLILAGHHRWLTFRGGPQGMDLGKREEALLKDMLLKATDQSNRPIHEALTKFDALPNVVGWCISDEPEAKLSEVAEAGYEVFKSNSPAHIVAQLSCDPHWFKNFRHSADVLIVDHYPFMGSDAPPRHLSVLETHKRIAMAVRDMEGKPVWLMPQLYSPSYWSCKPDEELSLADMRLACYAGLTAGAKGIIFYHWETLPSAWTRDEKGDRVKVALPAEAVAKRIERLGACVAELKRLAPVLTDGLPAEDISVVWTGPGRNGPGPQIYRVWDYDGARYLMTMNLLDTPVTGQVFGINASVNYRAYDATVLEGEIRAIPAKKPGEFFFEVAPRGAGVLKLTRRPIPPPKKDAPKADQQK